jgi:hypothetical protein
MNAAQALALHLAQRPEMPRPYNPNTPEAETFRRALQSWVEKKGDLEIDVRLEGVHIMVSERQQPTCSPRKDYEWRDMPARSHRTKAPRPAWSGATKEYNRMKQAERRAKIRQAVHEVQAERKAS